MVAEMREYKTMSDTSDEAARTRQVALLSEAFERAHKWQGRAEVAEKAARYWRRCALAWCVYSVIVTAWVVYVVGRI